ncbi:MAG: Glu-tRNA(Gln) amidotransferase GatDE subunit D, partial [Thermoprotei archaeon]
MREIGYYSDKVIELLSKHGVNIFDRVKVLWNDTVVEGVLLPRPEYGDPDTLILKLDNGYNIGVHVSNIKKLELISKGRKVELKPPRVVKIKKNLPKVAILGTGGTIASRVDYKTGAVYPSFTAEDVYALVPELVDIAYLE